MGRGGAGRVGIDPPGEDRALPGPSRELVLALHELYRGAGKPSSREIALAVEKGHYRDTVSHDTIAKMLRGHSFPRWDKWEPVVRALAARNAEQRDTDAEARRMQELWLAVQDHANMNETPGDIVQAPDITSGVGQIPRGAGETRSDPAAAASGLISHETAGCPMTDLETGGGRTLASIQRAVVGADGAQGARGGRNSRWAITIVTGLVVAIGCLIAASLATPPPGPAYWSGRVTFAEINFDAIPPQSNPKPSRDWTLAINEKQGTLWAEKGVREAVWPGAGNPSFRQCRDLISANAGIALKIWPGLRICVASARGRIAFLDVINLVRYKGYVNEIVGNAVIWR
jgi:hypothetical protein